MNLHVQISWQVQRFVNVHVQISWQAQHFVNLAPARNSFAVFDFENTSHFACSQELHLTFDCSCPVASARRCVLLILLCHRHNPVRCCELLILQEAQTLHRWRCVDQKSRARAFDWGTRVFERTGTLL